MSNPKLYAVDSVPQANRSAQSAATELHNRLLSRFQVSWKVFQFYLELDERSKYELGSAQAEFAAVFQKFREYKSILELQPDSSGLPLRLAALDKDLKQLAQRLQAHDEKVTVFQMRQRLETEGEKASGLVGHLLKHYLSKPDKEDSDRDKVDYLVTLCFSRQHPQLMNLDSLAPLSDEVTRFVGESAHLDTVIASELFDEYLLLVREAQHISELSDFLRLEIINRIREYKQKLREHFYHPTMLARIIVLNQLIRQRFESVLRDENKKTETHIIKLAEVGGDLVVENGASDMAGMNLVQAKDLQQEMLQKLNAEYSSTRDKINTLDRLRDTLERSVAYYGLNSDDAKNRNTVAAKTQNNLEEDDLRNAIADLGMMVRANLVPGAPGVRFKYRDVALTLSSWEVDAFREQPLSSDVHLRIRQAVRRTVGLIFVIQRILREQNESGGRTNVRRLLLTLEFYLLKGQEMQGSLKELLEAVVRQGMKIEAFHLSNTQSRLAAAIVSVRSVFEKSRTN